MNTIELEDSTFAVWCDQCDDWVCDFIPDGIEIKCTLCGNTLIRKLSACRQKEIRINLAKAILGLT